MPRSTALLAAVLLALGAAPGRAADHAGVELLGNAIARAGAPATYGFPDDVPGLVSDDDSQALLGPHGDHDDAEFVRDRVYRGDERVNASRHFGSQGAARGSIEAGHSISVTSGWADAGSTELGASAEAHAGSLGGSVGGAATDTAIEKRITILPGTSGLADGTLVTGLRWVFGGQGSLEVGGRSFPADSAASASVSFDLLVRRGPTGTCGPFDCPHGALAVAAELSTGLSAADADPALPAGVTARVTRHDSWSASWNAGDLKAGEVFTSGSETVDVGAPVTDEDVAILRSVSAHTGAPPLALDSIEFEANVGETLVVEMELDVGAAVDGWGHGDADAFDTFSGHVEDPQGRGLVFQSSVPVPGPPAGAAGALAATLLLALRARRALSRA